MFSVLSMGTNDFCYEGEYTFCARSSDPLRLDGEFTCFCFLLVNTVSTFSKVKSRSLMSSNISEFTLINSEVGFFLSSWST